MNVGKMISESGKMKFKRALKRNLFVYSLIGTQLIAFFIFYVAINFNSIIMSFQLRDSSGSIIWTLENFKLLFQGFRPGGALLMPLKNTMIYWSVGFIMIPFQVIPSYFLYKKIWLHKVLRVVFFFPTIVSPVVWSFLYQSFLSLHGPVAPVIQMIFGMESPPVLLGDPRYALGSVIFYSLWMGVPGSFVIYSGSLARVPLEILESARLDGVKWFRELYQILLPLIWPTVATTAILQFTCLFTASGNLFLLTGGEFNTNSISYYIFQQVYNLPEKSNTYNYASAIGMFFTILSLPIVFCAQYFMNRIGNTEY